MRAPGGNCRQKRREEKQGGRRKGTGGGGNSNIKKVGMLVENFEIDP